MAGEHVLYVLSLRVDPDHEAEFNRYYHREHIPAVFGAVPELRSARRYEQFGVDGSLQWYERRFLSIYEVDPSADLERFNTRGVLPADHPERANWERQSRHTHDVDRRVFRQVWKHPRTAWDGPFGSRPFFCVTADIDAADEPEFAAWYHGDYLPKNVAEVPGWVAVRRYESLPGGAAPRRTFVVYEAADEPALARCLAAMRTGSRIDENLAWHRWDDAIGYQDAATFRPIYRAPG